MKIQRQKQPAGANTVPCLKCGKPTSVYYFSPVLDKGGRNVPARCENCGFWEDPE